MARPKSFDVEDALSKATDVFWRKGYHATSMRDLLDAMKISRQSLYDTFGDKRQLYLRSLTSYGETLVGLLAPLYAGEPSLGAIRAHFQTFLAHATRSPEIAACMLANTALELGGHDPEARDIVYAHFGRIETLMKNAIANAIESGEIPAGHNPEAIAQLLSTLWYGLGVKAKSGASQEELQTIVDTTFAILNQAPNQSS